MRGFVLPSCVLQEAATDANRHFVCGLRELQARLKLYLSGKSLLTTPGTCYAPCLEECSQASGNVIVSSVSSRKEKTGNPVGKLDQTHFALCD